MKKIILIATCTASLSAHALPTYEPFTEYSGLVASQGQTFVALSNGVPFTNAFGSVNNAIDLATNGLVAPGGETWTALKFAGTAGASNVALTGLDVYVISNSSVFTSGNLSSLLPGTFPGFPAGGAISTIVENPAQPLIKVGTNAPAASANIVGNSPVLTFSPTLTRPATGTKTLFVSYLFSDAQNGQTGTGNDGRYMAFLASSNLVEGPGTGGFYTNWASMFNTFGTATNTPHFTGHGIIDSNASLLYIGACDTSSGKAFAATPFTSVFNTPNFVVGELVITPGGSTRDTNLIWVNPSLGSFGGATPPTSPVFVNLVTNLMGDVGGMTLIDRVGSGASGGVGTNYLANLIIGSTWSYVTGGPEFTNQPVAASGNVGATVNLTGAATAAAQSVTYQWQHVVGGVTNNVSNGAGGAGGTATISGATTTTLTISGLSNGDTNGTYQLLATASGTSYSLASTPVVVSYDPLISGPPQGYFTTPGGTAFFNITATTAHPSLTYQWRLNGANLADGTRGDGSVITGSTTAALTIANAQLDENNSTITCGVTNGIGAGEISDGATLITTDPAITSQPSPSQIVRNYGGTAVYTASVLTSPAHAPLTYAWYNGSTQLANGTQADGSVITGATGTSAGSSVTTSLTIANVTYQENNAQYNLHVTNSAGSSATSFSSTLLVNDPYVVAEPPAVVEIPQGGTKTITFNAPGYGETFQWYNASGPLSDGGDFSGTQTSTLTIANAQAGDANTYYATVQGVTNGFTSTSTTVYIDTPVTSVTLFPSTLTQQAGTHVALSGNVQGGTGGLLFMIWQLNGATITNGTLADGTVVTGADTTTLKLSNVHAADTGTWTLSGSNSAGALTATSSVTISSGLLFLHTNNLEVTRLGDGAEPLSATTGNTVFLDQFTTNGSYVSSIMIPDSGSTTLLNPGAGPDAVNETYLTLSSNNQFLNFTGYNATYPNAGTNSVTAAANVRGIGAVNGLGFYVRAYTNSGLYSGGSAFIRAVYSTDGLTNFWTTGAAGSAAIKYVNAGPAGASYQNGTGIPGLSTSIAGPHCIGLIGTNIAFSDNVNGGDGSISPSILGINQFAGAPQTGPATNTTQILTDGVSYGNDFAISPDLQTLYIADDDQSYPLGNGGIQRWDFYGGVWNYSYNLIDTTDIGTNGMRGLAVDWSASPTWGSGVYGAVLYSTTSESVSNRLIQIIDNPSPTCTALAVAGPNELLRGVRFGPQSVPVSIASGPTAVNTYTGQANTYTVVATGDAPFSYQWQFNGTNIPGATTSTLTINNLQTTNTGTYTAVVSNPISTNSAAGVLTVVSASPVTVLGLQSRVESVGDHLAFAVNATGSLPISYQWKFNGNTIPGATGSALILTNIVLTNTGTYMVTMTNQFGTNSSSGTLQVTAGLQSLSANNLIVARIGDGAQALSRTTGNTLYLDQITPAGVYSNTIMVPDNAGASNLIVPGAAPESQNGAILTRSGNGSYLNFAGFEASFPASTFNTSSGVFRAIAAVNALGFYQVTEDNQTIYNTSGDESFYSVASQDGLNEFWTTGAAGSGTGIKYATSAYAGSAGGNLNVAGTTTGVRVVDIVAGNIIYSDAQSTPAGLWAFPGEQTNGATNVVLLASDAAGNPGDFAFSPDSTTYPPTSSTIYLCDSSSIAAGGGIQRYDWNGAAYTLSYTLGTGAGSTVGAGGVAVDWSAHASWGPSVTGAIIYATTTGNGGNQLIKIVDTGAGSSATVLSQAASNQILRGIRFGPAVIPLAIVVPPASQAVVVGQTADFSVVANGDAPISYQWSVNGNAIPGATGTTYSIQNVQMSNAASYTVTISNAGSAPITSAPPAVLTVNPFTVGSDLVGWWTLGDGSGTNAADSSGYSDNGELDGFPTDNSEWIVGLDGHTALGYSNVDALGDNSVDVPDAPQLNFTNNLAFTLSAWIEAGTNLAASSAIISKGYGNGGEQYNLDVNGNVFRFFVRNASGTTSAITSTNTATPGRWQHLAATYDGHSRMMALYLNGQPIGVNNTAPTSLLFTARPLTIGNRPSSITSTNNLPFSGNLQDVRIYNVAFGAQDIQALYSTLAVPTSPSQFTTSPPAFFVAPGQFQLKLSGQANSLFRLWTTTNLSITPVTSWTLLTSGQFDASGNATYTDTSASADARFYQVTQP